MFKLFKKTLAVCFVGFGLRNAHGYITSNYRLAIFNWGIGSNTRTNMVSVLILNNVSSYIHIYNT